MPDHAAARSVSSANSEFEDENFRRTVSGVDAEGS
jgi:hypothetical protein